MLTDLVLSPFGARTDELVAAAHAADGGGFDTVWTYDHFSGLAGGAGWSRDPFVTLGAIAATTTQVGIGVLVANVVNRHPAQLACAVNSLQSLAPGRVRLGVGAGSSPTSRFAAEHAAIGRPLAGVASRRHLLAESIAALRAVWVGEAFRGEQVEVTAGAAVTDGTPVPSIIVGASSATTVKVAATRADGVNLLDGGDDRRLAELVAVARSYAVTEPFEVSVFAPFEPDHPLGGEDRRFAALGIDRRTLHIANPFPVAAIASAAARLRQSPTSLS